MANKIKTVKSTKAQRDELLRCHAGVGFLVYNAGGGSTIEFEFFVHDGQLRYVGSGKPVQFEIDERD